MNNLEKDNNNLKEKINNFELINVNKEKEIEIYQNQIKQLNIILKKNETINQNAIKLFSLKNLVISSFEYEYISSINNNLINENIEENGKNNFDNELLKQKMINLQLELNRQINKNEKLLKSKKNNKFNKIKFNTDIYENGSNLNDIIFNNDNSNIKKESNLIKLDSNSRNNIKMEDNENKYISELKEKEEQIEYLNNEIIELKTQLEEIEINKCNISEKEKEYEELINDYEAKIKFLKERNDFLQNKNNKYDSKEYEIICYKKYYKLKWFLLMKKNKNKENENNENYENYIWVDKLHIDKNCFTEFFKNYIDNEINYKKVNKKKIISSKNNDKSNKNNDKDFSFCEQNSDLSKE